MLKAVIRKALLINRPFIRDFRVFLIEYRQNLPQPFLLFYKTEGKIRRFFVKLGILRQGSPLQSPVGLKKDFRKGDLMPVFSFKSKAAFYKSNPLKKPQRL